ncbi:HlyD family efflux transporter periplasmic adaptor subunit [Pedobacter miscanthi]|uniref:Hemolysin D n=1 Tax=Pedobacter miscanthi TaxID=2259170 RepID=A0A366L232_9SPHI|nr:HlyD family efflux transporter periplasmic adaptor subunit [Pedobacter miscanthi]RBQ07840.1 hemolysin D [Pedobacter miscanthi]
MTEEEKLYYRNQRTEEVQHIIERMPTRFGLWISMIVTFIFISLFVFGVIIRYPDVVNGQITINANNAPLKLVANVSGKLKLNPNIHSLDEVQEGEVLAYIENATNPGQVTYIDSLLKLYNPNSNEIIQLRRKLPHNVSLGELNGKYYSFTNNLQEFINYKQDRLLDKQSNNFRTLLLEQQNGVSNAVARIEMARNSLDYFHKFYSRDSTLFLKKVISEAEWDKTQMGYLNSKDALHSAMNNLINAKQTVQQTESKLQELGIQTPEKEKELSIALLSTYNDLMDNIKSWQQKYVFKASFRGKVQFLKFYNENQFVQAGEQIFTIIPKDDKAYGQVMLPAEGSGKIKIGQEVIVKLENYPYMEYGSVKGVIKAISLTTNITKTERSDVETYQILVDFPSQLKTNYGASLDFRAEAKGSAEIITNDRRLIERLFDNIKYAIKK